MKTVNGQPTILSEKHQHFLLNELFIDVYGELSKLNHDYYNDSLDVDQLARQINLDRIKKTK
ncbi:MAG: hypothetical protein K1X54_02180 [Flavobacteriales bacterium]|nr:hypothetical protein [Flavobacteriales bacterium]